ncbi:hypothetical protein [Acrocarpospora sp. B8E8]|uniref:hypothetical protein n=1 Tax=Acrocarpospora sp. B8E8 TaxID=3153572 RepID=UPI00325DC104
MADIQTIVNQLGKLSVDLDNAVDLLCEIEEIAVDAEADYKKAFAEAFEGGIGPVESRKQQAVIKCDKLYRISGKAQAAVRKQVQHLRALHARIEVGRTIQSTARAEIALTNAGVR